MITPAAIWSYPSRFSLYQYTSLIDYLCILPFIHRDNAYCNFIYQHLTNLPSRASTSSSTGAATLAATGAAAAPAAEKLDDQKKIHQEMCQMKIYIKAMLVKICESLQIHSCRRIYLLACYKEKLQFTYQPVQQPLLLLLHWLRP